MALTTDDIQLIRTALLDDIRQIIQQEVRPIVREEVYAMTEPRFAAIEADIDTMKNDIKAIYQLLTKRGLKRILNS